MGDYFKLRDRLHDSIMQNVWTKAEAAVFGQEMENARRTLYI